MKENKGKQDEFRKFDAVVNKLITVSHQELQQREREYKKHRTKKKRAKS